jgi:hypothetical protein
MNYVLNFVFYFLQLIFSLIIKFIKLNLNILIELSTFIFCNQYSIIRDLNKQIISLTI